MGWFWVQRMGNGIGLLTAGGVHPIPSLSVPRSLQATHHGRLEPTRVGTCVCAHGAGVDATSLTGGACASCRGRFTFRAVKGSCRSSLARSLLLLLSLLWAQTQPVPGLDPQSPSPAAPLHRAATFPGQCRRHPGRGGLHPPLLPGRAEPLPRADFSISPGTCGPPAASRGRTHSSPSVDTLLNHRLITQALTKSCFWT